MNKIDLLKKIDSLLGPFAVSAAKALITPREGKGKNVDAILVIRPGGIGDAALIIPAIKTLKRQFSNAAINILAETRNAAVFSLSPEVQAVFRHDRPKELFLAISATYDMVIDAEQWHRFSAVVARLTEAPLLIGYATNERRKLFTHPVQYFQEDYEADSFLNLIAPVTGQSKTGPDAPFLALPEEVTAAVLPQMKPLTNGKIISLFPGGSISERKWGSGRFHQTAKVLSEKGFGIAVVGGKDDVGAGEEIVSGLSGALNLCGKLTLPETAAALKESSLLITGDSGIMHIGYGLGIKVLALFGPGREKKWAPRGKNCRVINKHLPCGPCTTFGYTPKCRNNAACMSAITVEEVVNEAMVLLKGH